MPSEPTLSVAEFYSMWGASGLSETQGSQSHFRDLCAMLGVDPPPPNDPDTYTFERPVYDADGEYVGSADVWKANCFGWEYKSPGKSLRNAYTQLRGYQEGLGNPPILVVCDMRTFEIHTTFTNAPARTIRFTLKDLVENPTHYCRILRNAFEPSGSGREHPLHPDRDPRYITETAASKFGEVAEALRALDHDPNVVARFLNRMVFAFFAESVGLFRSDYGDTYKLLTITLQNLSQRPERTRAQIAAVFRAMSSRETPDFGPFPVPWFNGGLFDESAERETFALTGDLVNVLLETGQLDWSRIDPAIFGTLFERGLDPDRRTQLGAHYTDPDNIMRVVEPVLLRPLRREFSELRLALQPLPGVSEADAPPYGENGSLSLDEPAPDSTEGRIRAFHDRLANVRVLDPACGSGNFLYVAMRELKQLEQELIDWAHGSFGINGMKRRVGPANMLGIDIDQYAVDLTRLSLWIGDIQWTMQQGLRHLSEPILGQIDQIECRDAILDIDNEGNPVPAQWPAAEFIVGNPPFLGGKLLRRELGSEVVERLRTAWGDLISGNSDLCTYWHEQARQHILRKQAKRAGLLATNSITQQVNRPVLERIIESGGITAAFRDEPWVPDGAAVRIAIIAQDDGTDTDRSLDGSNVEQITPALTTGPDLGGAKRLRENRQFSYRGGIRAGPFDVSREVGTAMLAAPTNVNGRPNADVVFPLIIGRDLAQGRSERFVIDFGEQRSLADAAKYERPFEYVKKHVQPWREQNPNPEHPEEWWRHFVPQRNMRNRIHSLPRWIATPETSKHRFFVWITDNSVPDISVIAILRSDDYALGVLQSNVHELWSFAQGSRIGVGNDIRYMPTRTFETFPFPWPLSTPEGELTDVQREHRDAISSAAASLHAQREARLGPSAIGSDDAAAGTITSLYNDPPTWLTITHDAIDEAVCAAYGWSAELTDDEILSRLLELNRQRAAAEP